LKSPRNTGLDLLRFVLMSLGVLLHTLCAYLTSYKIPEFPVFDGSAQHWSADALVLVIHSFRMPLFFMISGFLAGHSLSKPSGDASKFSLASTFIKKRFQRIALPFVGSLIVLLPLFRWCLNTFQPSSEPLAFQMSFLWFLYHLWVFNLGVGIFRRTYIRLTQLPFSLWVGTSMLLTLWTLSETNTGVLITSDAWLPPVSLLLFHFGYFALGGALWHHSKALAPLTANSLAHRPHGLMSSTLAVGALVYILGVQKLFQGQPQWLWPTTLLHSTLTLGLSLHLFRWFTNREWTAKKTIQYLADSSYTIYLIHPIGVAMLVPLAALNINWWPQLSRPVFVFSLTMLFSFIVYELLVRRTPLKKVL